MTKKIAVSIVLWLSFLGCALAQAPDQGRVVSPCGTPGITYTPGGYGPMTVDTTGTLCASGGGGSSGGFTPSVSGARGTPLSVTTSDSSGNLPTGAVVVVSNVGTNPMYCNVNGVAATTSDQLITASGGWFAFTIPAAVTTLHCIATGGTTTANTVGGSGLATGTGGGGSSGGGSVTQGTSPWVDNITQFGGNNVATGTGAGGSGIPRVTVSNDSTLGIVAGQASVGNVGALTKTVCVTPTVTSATYAANVVVGGLLTFANLFTSTGHGTIQTVALNFNTAQTVGFKLYPFRGSPTNASTWTDHSAAAISGFTDIALTDQPIQLANPDSGLGTMTNYGAIGLGQAYNPAGTSGFFILVPTATTATLGGTANVVQVCVTVLQDS